MILIVDDNDDVRRMIRSLIEEIETDVIEASDGGSAIEAFERHRPDWVLMDVNMHPVDGLTAMRTILEKHRDAQIIIVSQHQDVRTRTTALGMGAHAFVGKEDLMELRELIKEGRQSSDCQKIAEALRTGLPAGQKFTLFRRRKMRIRMSTPVRPAAILFAICMIGLFAQTGNAKSFTVTNTPPVAVADEYIVIEDRRFHTPSVFDGVLANDTDADGDPLTAILVTGPSHDDSGQFNLLPDGRIETYGNNGPVSDSFTYKVSDGQSESNIVTVHLIVTPLNDLPVLSSKVRLFSIPALKSATSFTPYSNDEETPDLVFSLVDAPAGVLIDPSTGVFNWTPTLGQIGPHQFQLCVSDGEASTCVPMDMTVTDPNTPTILVADATRTGNYGNDGSIHYEYGVGIGYRNFFLFDLNGVTGQVNRAFVKADNSDSDSTPNNVSYSLYDVTTPLDILGANGPYSNLPVFDDLGTGTLFGSVVVPLVAPAVTVELNPDGIAAVQQRLGMQLAFGGDYPSDYFLFIYGQKVQLFFEISANDSNTAPTITGQSISRQQAAGASTSTIGNVSDDASGLSVTVNGSSSVNGVTVSNVAVGAGGNVTADVSAACAASNASFTLQVTDAGGLTSNATLNVTVTNETTNPVINGGNPLPDVIVYLPLNSPALSMPVSFAPTAADNCTASPTVVNSPASGSTFNLGTTTVNVTATDLVNNSSQATFKVKVLFNFGGLLQPLDPFPVLNIATAGSAIPVKFSLSGNKGLAIFAAGYPASSAVPCSQNEPGDVVEETVSSGGSTLAYDAASDQYRYVWKTEKSWKNTCRILVLRFADGTEQYAKTRFK